MPDGGREGVVVPDRGREVSVAVQGGAEGGRESREGRLGRSKNGHWALSKRRRLRVGRPAWEGKDGVADKNQRRQQETRLERKQEGTC